MKQTKNERVKEIRTLLNLTQAQMCQRLNITLATLSRIENNGYELSAKIERAILDNFGVNKEWFETGKGQLKKYNNGVPKISNQKYNSYLKEISEIVGIEKPITTHVGRKTCGSILLNAGVSIEVVSRILGHRDTKITQHIYAKVNELRITREIETIKLF